MSLEDAEFITEWPPVDIKEDEISGEKAERSFSARKLHKKMRFNSSKQTYALADVALATWWRKTGCRLYSHINLPDSNCPSTVIHFLSGTREGQLYLEKYLEELKGKIQLTKDLEDSAEIYAAMATVWERLEKYPEAENCMDKSLLLLPLSKENKWIRERVRRQLFMKKKREEMNLKLPNPVHLPKSKDVLRIATSELSVENFQLLHCAHGVPIIITGINDITNTKWDLNHILEIGGDKNVIPKCYVNYSIEWAKLENSDQVTVRELIEGLNDPATARYLFDWSLPLHCPELAREINIPKYFTNNYIQETVDGTMYKDSWPSLFVSPKNVNSKLHIDTNGTHFWMALFQGRKRWTIFPPSDTPFLYPKYHSSLDPVFEIDLQNVNFNTHPLYACTNPQTFDLQPGEVLFVPAGCPHEVVNLDVTVAISGNFINETNVDSAVKELEVNSLVDERARDLLKQIKCKCKIQDTR